MHEQEVYRSYNFKYKKTTSQSILYVGAYLISPLRSTIGDGRLNCRIRNENGCTPSAKAPTYNIHCCVDIF